MVAFDVRQATLLPLALLLPAKGLILLLEVCIDLHVELIWVEQVGGRLEQLVVDGRVSRQLVHIGAGQSLRQVTQGLQHVNHVALCSNCLRLTQILSLVQAKCSSRHVRHLIRLRAGLLLQLRTPIALHIGLLVGLRFGVALHYHDRMSQVNVLVDVDVVRLVSLGKVVYFASDPVHSHLSLLDHLLLRLHIPLPLVDICVVVLELGVDLIKPLRPLLLNFLSRLGWNWSHLGLSSRILGGLW